LARVLRAEGLAAFRGERLVLRDISFTVAAGGALLLKGPNGSGKSTLLRLIAGLVRAAAGRLLWNGEDALADLAGQGARTAYLGHQDAVKPGLTVAENLRFAARMGGGSVPAALDRMNLGPLADLPARMLSAGQKRRLALARLLCAQRPLWLLDEPTVSLDSQSQDMLAGIVNAHLAMGGIVIAATHTGLGWAEMTAFDLERAIAISDTAALEHAEAP
jgi:heme exporter protein A